MGITLASEIASARGTAKRREVLVDLQRRLEEFVELAEERARTALGDQRPAAGERVGTRPYVNHCWSCESDIDSRRNDRCELCGLFLCSECGSCYHDSPAAPSPDEIRRWRGMGHG